MRCRFLASLALAFLLAAASVAQAEMVRVPKSGEPAYAFEAPLGWEVIAKAPAAVRLASVIGHTALELSIVDSAEVAAMPLSAIAGDLLRLAHLPPSSLSQPGSIAGHGGESYAVHGRNDKDVPLTAVLTVAKLDATHVATMMWVAAEGISPTEAAELEHLVGAVRIVGVR